MKLILDLSLNYISKFNSGYFILFKVIDIVAPSVIFGK